MKTFEITIRAYTTVVVEADNKDDALELIMDDHRAPSGWEIEDWDCSNELSPKEAKDAIRFSPYHMEERMTEPFRK